MGPAAEGRLEALKRRIEELEEIELVWNQVYRMVHGVVGLPAPDVRLEGTLATRLHALVTAERDLDSAIGVIGQLHALLIEHDVYRALDASSVRAAVDDLLTHCAMQKSGLESGDERKKESE